MKGRKHLWFFFLLFSFGCQQKPGEATANVKGDAKEEKKDKGGRDKKAPPIPSVRVETASQKITPIIIQSPATLIGINEAEVYSKVSGRVAQLGPKEGERVTQGQILLRIDRNDPGESYLTIPIASPISGWVGRWLVTNLGEPITALEPLVVITDDQILRAQIQMPTADWLKVTPQSKAHIRIGEITREARVKRIARAANATSGKASITVEVNNEDHIWKSGQMAEVIFEVDPKPRILVPSSCVLITDSGAYLYKLSADNKAQRQRIEFTLFDNDHIEVLSGVNEGERIITEGANQLTDQAQVQIISAAKGQGTQTEAKGI